MKNRYFIIMILCILSMFMIGCRTCKQENAIVKTGYDFEACYKSAYDYMVDTYGDSAFYFYEAQAEMSLLTDDSNFVDSSNVIDVKVVFQLRDAKVVRIEFPEGKYDTIDYIVTVSDGEWTEDIPLNINNIECTLGTAKSLYGKLDIVKPRGQYILMRHPDLDGFDNAPYFFFGIDSSFIAMDKSGKIVNY